MHRLHNLAPIGRKPPHVGSVQVHRSIAVRVALMSSSTITPACVVVICRMTPEAEVKPFRVHQGHQKHQSRKGDVDGTDGGAGAGCRIGTCLSHVWQWVSHAVRLFRTCFEHVWQVFAQICLALAIGPTFMKNHCKHLYEESKNGRTE